MDSLSCSSEMCKPKTEGRSDERGNFSRTQQGQKHPSENLVAKIETLPPELLFYLSHFLDLAGLVVFSTATCRNLRVIFGQFDRELLFLEPPHRLNLAEWREAAQAIDRFGLTRTRCTAMNSSDAVESTYAKGPGIFVGKITQTMHELVRDDSLVDLDLFQAVLKFLAGSRFRDTVCNFDPQELDATTKVSKPDGQESRGTGRIRCLHLTGWHGIAGAFLIQQIRLQPSLKDVCTIVKTERADNRIWEQAAADDQKAMQWMMGPIQGIKPPAHSATWLRYASPGPGPCMGSTSTTFPTTWQHDHPMPRFERCRSTQIIVQVGRRRPRRQGQAYLRGEGLQIGYQGYCIDVTTAGDLCLHEGTANALPISAQVQARLRGCSGTENRLELKATAASSEAPHLCPSPQDELDSSDEHSGQDVTRRRLHVILQGREDLGAEGGERRQNEEMFERSIVTCNSCKERLMF